MTRTPPCGAFAAQLKDAVDLDTVHAELLAAAGAALEPGHASIWLAGGQAGTGAAPRPAAGRPPVSGAR